MATWYSIKNRLESGEVKATNTFERFLTVFITSYGCIDMWYRDVTTSSEDDEREVRIYYLQKDTTFTAANTWERNNERPKFWLQFKGNEETIRASMISLLPYISQLHDQKRHGEWNFGATQPFEGQGSIITPAGNGFVVSGRFGDLVITNNGVIIDWETITWAFDGCNPTATIPLADDVCLKNLGVPVADCGGGPAAVGTCLTGSCGNWSGTYPITDADCSGIWFEKQDLSGYTQEQWNANQSCPDPTGTCVTGDCDNGFSAAYPVTQANCNGIDWFEGVDLSGNNSAYWENYYNCPAPIGCCVIGTTCNWLSVSETTEAQCTTNAGSRPFTWTEGNKGETCTLEYLSEANNCNTVPATLSLQATLAYSDGTLSAYLGCDGSGDAILPFISPGTMAIVTPGQPGIAPTSPRSSQPGDCAGYTYNADQMNKNQAFGSTTFNLTATYLYSIGDTAYYGIDDVQGWPGIVVNKTLRNFLADNYLPPCSFFTPDDEGWNHYEYSSENATTRIPGTMNGLLTRASYGGNLTFYGGSVEFTPLDSSLPTRTLNLNSNINNWRVPSLTCSPGWYKALHGSTPPVNQGCIYELFNKNEPLSSLEISFPFEGTPSIDTTYGASLIEQFYTDPDGINRYRVEAYRLTATMTESGTANETGG